MGGNALLTLGIQVERIEGRELYDRLCEQAIALLRQYFERAEVLNQIGWKTSFGDIDILVSDPIRPWDVTNTVISGDTTSFLFLDKYQVDAICIYNSSGKLSDKVTSLPAKDDFGFAQMNMYSDMSACLGGMLKRMNLKFSYNGLWYIGDDISPKMLLTNQVEPFLKFMGLPYPFRPDFTSYEAFYEFLLQTWFPLAPYILSVYEKETELLSDHRHKSNNFRNGRECFVGFVKHCVRRKEELLSHTYLHYGKPLDLIACFGEDKKKEYEDRLHTHQRGVAFREKCNGKMVMRLCPGLKGESLGAFMTSFIAKYGKERIMEMSSNELEMEIRTFIG